VSTKLLLDTKEQVANLIALGVIDPVELARNAFLQRQGRPGRH